MLWVGGVVISAIGFLVGRVFAQSEAIMMEKRRIYEGFLKVCPVPSSAYSDWSSEIEFERTQLLQETIGSILIYAEAPVAFALSRYFEIFDEVDRVLTSQSEPRDPEYLRLAQAHNDLILEMRRDILRWSVFAYRGKRRFTLDAKKVDG